MLNVIRSSASDSTNANLSGAAHSRESTLDKLSFSTARRCPSTVKFSIALPVLILLCSFRRRNLQWVSSVSIEFGTATATSMSDLFFARTLERSVG